MPKNKRDLGTPAEVHLRWMAAKRAEVAASTPPNTLKPKVKRSYRRSSVKFRKEEQAAELRKYFADKHKENEKKYKRGGVARRAKKLWTSKHLKPRKLEFVLGAPEDCLTLPKAAKKEQTRPSRINFRQKTRFGAQATSEANAKVNEGKRELRNQRKRELAAALRAKRKSTPITL